MSDSSAPARVGIPRTRGRPRNAGTDRVILSAACELLLDRGYRRLSMEAVAARSGVGKPTLYLRWPNKAALVADAVFADLASRTAPGADDALSDTGDIAHDLREWFATFVDVATDDRNAFLIRALIAVSGDSPDDAGALFGLLTGARREALTTRFRAAVSAGQIGRGVDLDATVDMLFGSVLIYLLTGQADTVRRRADHVLEIVLHGLCRGD